MLGVKTGVTHQEKRMHVHVTEYNVFVILQKAEINHALFERKTLQHISSSQHREKGLLARTSMTHTAQGSRESKEPSFGVKIPP